MPEAFLRLPPGEQREALEVASDRSGRPTHLLEKDVWVVWALGAVFDTPFGNHLAFKGGTSLSKAYRVIQRFSEDIDLTLDVRYLLADHGTMTPDGLPPNKTQAAKWTKKVRALLPEWVADTLVPTLEQAAERDGLTATIRADGEKVYIDHDHVAVGTGYASPSVMLELGARATGEPVEVKPIACDAAENLKELAFPTASPRVMRAERTFWEKATAAHVYCLQEKLRGDRFSRHWHDLARLAEAGIAASAVADHDLALAVADHKSLFFAEKDATKAPIDYRRPYPGRSAWCRLGLGFRGWKGTTRAWLQTGSCGETRNPSASSWTGARGSRPCSITGKGRS